MSKKTLQSKKKQIEKHFDAQTWLGKNLRDKVVPAGIEREQSAIEKIVNWAVSTVSVAKAGKARSFEITYQPGPAENGDVVGDCQICEHPNIKRASRISAKVNGKIVYTGTDGPLVGKECEKHIVYIFEAAPYKGFKMYEQDAKNRQAAREKTAKVTLKLDQLPKNIVKRLQKRGFDLQGEIATDAVRDVQRTILRGDYSRLERELDPGKTKDMVKWALQYKKDGKVYDPDVYHTLTLLEHYPERVQAEQWAQFVLFYWQHRPFNATGELAGAKDDILYLEKLPTDHPLIKEYSRIDRKLEAVIVRAFSNARWESRTIGQLLEADSVTKAQARSLRYSVNGLAERRERHNRELMNSYCKPDEFNRLLGNLRERYHTEKQTYCEAKKSKIKQPSMPWAKGDYLAMRDFFDDEEKVTKHNKISTRDYVVKFVSMPDAANVVRTLYVEGRKLDLAARLGNDNVLKQAYSTMQEANRHIPELEQKLDVLFNAAIEFKDTPKHTKEKLQKTKMTQKNVERTIQDLKEASAAGLIPTKYLQPQGNKPSVLERVLGITAEYKQDETTANHINYLRQLESELGVVIHKVRAEDGHTMRRKADAPFKTQAYAGKTYFSREQIHAVSTIMHTLSAGLRNVDIPKAKEAVANVEKFFAEHEIYNAKQQRYYDDTLTVVEKEKLPYEWGWSIKFKPFEEYQKLNEGIKAFQEGKESPYMRLNKELRYRIDQLKHNRLLRLPENIEEVLANEKTVVTKALALAIDEKYDAMVKSVISEGLDKYENPRNNHFDIIAHCTHPDPDKADHKLNIAFGKKHNGKNLLQKTREDEEVYQNGRFAVPPRTWFGGGRMRGYVGYICSKADKERDVYIKIVNARR